MYCSRASFGAYASTIPALAFLDQPKCISVNATPSGFCLNGLLVPRIYIYGQVPIPASAGASTIANRDPEGLSQPSVRSHNPLSLCASGASEAIPTRGCAGASEQD